MNKLKNTNNKDCRLYAYLTFNFSLYIQAQMQY